LSSEDSDDDIFIQGNGVVTKKTPFEEKGKDLWVIIHYKVAYIEDVPVKDR